MMNDTDIQSEWPLPFDPCSDYREEGWTTQFTASGSRLKEAIELYEKLGVEVKTVPVSKLNCSGCTLCFEGEQGAETMLILTRKPQKTQNRPQTPNDAP